MEPIIRKGDPRGKRFIVAEVAKNWIAGQPVSDLPVIGELFEIVIERNFDRGYELHSFSLHRMMTGDPLMDALNETIIAVFQRIDTKIK